MSTIERGSGRPLTRSRQQTSRFLPRTWPRARAHLPCFLRRPGTLLPRFQQPRWEGLKSFWKTGCSGIREGSGRANGLDSVNPAVAQESGGGRRAPEESASGNWGGGERWKTLGKVGSLGKDRGSPRKGKSLSVCRWQPFQRGRVFPERQKRSVCSALRRNAWLPPIGLAYRSVEFMGGTSPKHSCFFAALQ